MNYELYLQMQIKSDKRQVVICICLILLWIAIGIAVLAVGIFLKKQQELAGEILSGASLFLTTFCAYPIKEMLPIFGHISFNAYLLNELELSESWPKAERQKLKDMLDKAISERVKA